MKFSLDILNDYIERGLVVKQNHPTLPLSIYNYSRVCQYDRIWDDITKQCRALILDNEGNVIAKSFSKFFNIEENYHVPTNNFTVQEKMDGSLIIGFLFDGELIITSKGSFISEQSVWAKKIMDEKYSSTLLTDKDVYEATDYNFSGDELTYIFELIVKNNRIVVDYGDTEELFLLSCIHTKTGKELTYSQVKKISEIIGCPIVKQYDGITDFNELKNIINDNQEGFVVKFSNGSMCKIKGDEYIRLHKILTNCSTTEIWEYLKNGSDMNELLEKVPDEFDKWVRDVVDNLQKQFDEIKTNMEDEFAQLVNKKEFALKIVDNPMKSLLFKRLNSYSPDLNDMIWKMVKPQWGKPFREDIDK